MMNLECLEKFLTEPEYKKNRLMKMSEHSDLEIFYEETKVYHEKISKEASLNLIYLIFKIGRVPLSVLSKEHLILLVENIKFIDISMSYFYYENKKRAEFNTTEIINLIKLYFNKKTQKIFFNKAIKSETIKTMILRLKYREYLDVDNLKLKKSILSKPYFIRNSGLHLDLNDPLNKKITSFMKKDFQKTDRESKRLFITIYKELFTEEEIYNHLKDEYIKLIECNGDLSTMVLSYSDGFWLKHWECLSKEYSKELNKTISDEKSFDFFKTNNSNEDSISNKEMSKIILKLGFNFIGESLNYSNISSIEDKKDFVNKTLILPETTGKNLMRDRSIKRKISAFERLIPPMERMKLINEFRCLIDYKTELKDTFSLKKDWDEIILDVFESYIFEYCEKDLNISDEMLEMLIIQYAK